MTAALTTEALAAMEARAVAATAGPFVAYYDEDAGRPCVEAVARGDHRSRFLVAEMCSDSKADADFFAAARDDVPALLAEVRRLRRQMEHATPWQVSEVPTDEEMRALRMRWAFGPEKYQADADSLIAAVIHGREENARLRAIVEGLRERAAAQLRARAACLRSYADSADADDHANDAAHYRAEASEADTCAGIVAATLLSPAPREPAADDVGRDAPGVG